MDNVVGNNVNALRIDRELSQKQLAGMLGVSRTTVSNWECGKSLPHRNNLERFEEALGVTFDEVMSEQNGYHARLKRRHPHGGVLRPSCERARATAPVLGSIAAGRPDEMIERADPFPVPTVLKQRYPRSFYLTVRGNSMNRTLPDGCLALVDRAQVEPNPYDAFALQVGDDDATIKRVRAVEGGVVLVPDSHDDSCAPLFYAHGATTAQIRILGKVVWVTTPFDYRA